MTETMVSSAMPSDLRVVVIAEPWSGDVLYNLPALAESLDWQVRSYTGKGECSDGGMLPFFTSSDDSLVVALMESIQRGTLKRAEPELWSVSSEAGYFSTIAELPVVCFGPGEDRFTHNRLEQVRVEDLITAAKVYASMIYKLCC